MSKAIPASVFSTEMRRALASLPKRTGEREGRFRRLCGMPREWIENECRNDIRYADMLRGWDASEAAGEAI